MSSKKVAERPTYRGNSKMFETPRKRDIRNVDMYALSETKLAMYGLIFSLAIIVMKLYYSNKACIEELIFERQLISLEQATEEGEVAFKNIWVHSIKYSKYWLPVLCGLLTTYFTWLLVYLDSDVPGVQPPSPLSPTKYKLQSGHSFHLNYVFALLVGVLVSIYMLWKEISL